MPSKSRLVPEALHKGRRFVERVGAVGVATILVFSLGPARAADPIKIGLSLSLTGATAPAGRQVQAGLDIWRDHTNARGGLLGRPVELVYYDDQRIPRTRRASTPS
jgi:ABC-type branched-subunit amino acid transport system substrate-binding protein